MRGADCIDDCRRRGDGVDDIGLVARQRLNAVDHDGITRGVSDGGERILHAPNRGRVRLARRNRPLPRRSMHKHAAT